jgi:flagellar assembly factor FliW
MLQGEYRMTGSGSAMVGHPMVAQADPEVIESRFGPVTIHASQPIVFTSGLLGMPDKTHFCLTHFPSEKMARFKLLQSLDDHTLSFITLPVDIQNPVIDRADLEQAALELNIPTDSLAVLLITSVHRESGAPRLSVNARAPLLMHADRRIASQYVFSHTKYLIRQPLTF